MIFNKIRKHYFLLLSTFLFLYALFNLLDGERGLISYFDKKEKYKNLVIEKQKLNNQLLETEHKISLLSDNIDLDYIEILIREKFFFGKAGENVYIINDNES